MSFYGNVTYYLSNAFKSIVYDNGSSNSTITAPANTGGQSGVYTLIPRGRDDETRLIAYNKWVRFGGNATMSENNQVYIYHAVNNLTRDQGSENNLFQPKVLTSGTATISPGFGEIVTLPKITFDAAGHLVAGEMINMKIPVNPGLTDINSLKYRVAQLEELINGNGQHGDSGQGNYDPSTGTGDDGIVIETENSVASQLSALKAKTAEWIMQSDFQDNASYNKRETNGIGTTLHQLMVQIGTRKAADFTIEGQTYHGYEIRTDASNDPSTIIGQAALAVSGMNLASTNINLIKSVINDICDRLVSTTFPGTEQKVMSQEFATQIANRLAGNINNG